MIMTKAELIEFLNERFSADTTFEISLELQATPDDNSLIGTTFGSAQHLIRSAAKKIFSEQVTLHVMP